MGRGAGEVGMGRRRGGGKREGEEEEGRGKEKRRREEGRMNREVGIRREGKAVWK